MKRRSGLILEMTAWSLAVLCGTVWLSIKLQAGISQNIAAHISEQERRTASSEGATAQHSIASLSKASNSVPEDAVMGRLEVASIGLTVPVLNDFDPASLRKGVGHIHGTALPGGLGNMALAGHRDTFFRPLRNIKRGMTMSVFTRDGRYDYQVDSTEVVAPEDVRVLAIHDLPEMTLITCFPFDFIGSAPQRFIVRAHIESLEPAASLHK